MGISKNVTCSNYNKVHNKEHNISEHIIDEAMQEVLDSFKIFVF